MDARRGARWKLDELAERAGVSARTVRYYVQRGLLPAPEFRGPDTAYTDEHLARLRAVRALQERHLPLDEIQSVLAGRSPEAVERIAAGELPEAAKPPPVERAEVAPETSSRWRRHALLPGVELHVDEAAGREARALAEALLREAARHAPRRGR